MARYQIWNKTDDIYTPSGNMFTAAEWTAKYPWVKIPGAKMIISAGIINGGCALEFESAKENYIRRGAAISDGMTDEEILAAMEALENTLSDTSTPTTEERTAAALEYIAMSSLPDTEEV